MKFSRIRNISCLIIVIILVSIWTVNYVVRKTTRNQMYTEVSKIPRNRVGLLLGTAKYMDKGRNMINPYYQNRIDAAVTLYMAGKVDYIIVSGDNSTQFYNEPLLMKRDLMAQGVPENKIFFDFAGLRTLDSILRCRDIFGQTTFTVISQRFHNERAVFIANNKHLTTIGFCAEDGPEDIGVVVREKLARVKMMFDLLLNKQAKYNGEKVEIR